MKTGASVYLLTVIGFSHVSSAQDIIYFNDGSTQQAKILTVGTSEIEYKLWANQTGPTYHVLKNKLERIVYENGYTDWFELNDQEEDQKNNKSSENEYIYAVGGKYFLGDRRMTIPEVEQKLSECSDGTAMELFADSKRVKANAYMMGIASLAVIAGTYVGSIAIWILELSGDLNVSDQAYVTGFVCIASAAGALGIGNIILRKKYKKMRVEAVKIYNQNL